MARYLVQKPAFLADHPIEMYDSRTGEHIPGGGYVPASLDRPIELVIDDNFDPSITWTPLDGAATEAMVRRQRQIEAKSSFNRERARIQDAMRRSTAALTAVSYSPEAMGSDPQRKEPAKRGKS